MFDEYITLKNAMELAYVITTIRPNRCTCTYALKIEGIEIIQYCLEQLTLEYGLEDSNV